MPSQLRQRLIRTHHRSDRKQLGLHAGIHTRRRAAAADKIRRQKMRPAGRILGHGIVPMQGDIGQLAGVAEFLQDLFSTFHRRPSAPYGANHDSPPADSRRKPMP